ncbi:MAG: hypothetical protein MJ158_02635 [Alphaproteobacteria bacterium]|nr:hypothetical protein [Alphaproteobacteria bacterium]
METNNMTIQELLSLLSQKDAVLVPVSQVTNISIINVNLQKYGASLLPAFLVDLYKSTGGIHLGSAYIFGPTEINRDLKAPIPSIVDINKDNSLNKPLFGKLIFGRNDLFTFATDLIGNCYMMDNSTLTILRKYDEPFKAILDCLIIGKF